MLVGLVLLVIGLAIFLRAALDRRNPNFELKATDGAAFFALGLIFVLGDLLF